MSEEEKEEETTKSNCTMTTRKCDALDDDVQRRGTVLQRRLSPTSVLVVDLEDLPSSSSSATSLSLSKHLQIQKQGSYSLDVDDDEEAKSTSTPETEKESSLSSSDSSLSTLNLSTSSLTTDDYYNDSNHSSDSATTKKRSVTFASSLDGCGWGKNKSTHCTADSSISTTPLERIYYIPCREDLLDETPRHELWYTRKEYRMMKESTEKIVDLLRAGVLQAAEAAQQFLNNKKRQQQQKAQQQRSNKERSLSSSTTTTSLLPSRETIEDTYTSSISNMICIQGLEGSYGKGKTERSRLRRRSVLAVMMEQDMQTQDGYTCHELIAEMYNDYSETARDMAYNRAKELERQLVLEQQQ